MGKYCNKSAVTEATQFTGQHLPDVEVHEAGGILHWNGLTQKVYPGDWVITRPSGDKAVWPDTQFRASFQEIKDE